MELANRRMWLGGWIFVAFSVCNVAYGAATLHPPMARGVATEPYLVRTEGGALAASSLRCEYLENPLGVDVPKPRLSWIVESPQRGQKQTAYRVLVARTAETLATNAGDLWDSGKVDGNETIAIEYAGTALKSHQRCFWKVQVWDRDGVASAWSAPAEWSMGMLEAADWQCEWIGYDRAREEAFPDAPLEGGQWIWEADGEKNAKAAGKRVFAMELKLGDNVKIAKAELYAVGDDKMKFAINGKQVAETANFRTLRHLVVTEHIKPGSNALRAEVENTAKGFAGLLARLVMTTEDGQTITVATDGGWKVSPESANWLDGPLDLNKLPAAVVVATYGDAPWGKLKMTDPVLPPPVHLRGEFEVGKPVKYATLYSTALGLCDVQINGQRVSADRFNPGWTDYAKRVYYRAYDVTRLLREGKNDCEAVLADGWFSGYVGYGHRRDLYGKHPRFRGQIVVEYGDGSTAVVAATGAAWKAATGPIREADFLMGESYDARLEHTEADTRKSAGVAAWEPVVTGTSEVNPGIQRHPGPPVIACGEFKPKSISEPTPGAFVFDLGQNFAGVVRLNVSGEAGQKIQLRYAERLNPDGMIYTVNLRGARTIDTYICRGGGPETWEPRFTFHGFQYVEVTGLKAPPTQDTITGIALSSDTPRAGEFACSDPMLNQLASNVYWTQRANFIDVPTDCPQRDERLGWTGDAQVYVTTATLNCDVHAFFAKWLVDLSDAQRDDGQFPMVAPLKVAEGDGGPAWADAGVICPWTIYEAYGDRRLLESQYPSMVRFVEFCHKRSTPELLPPKQYHCFGDWVSIKADTPNDVIYTAYFARSTELLARAAQVLGKTEDEKKYADLAKRIKQAFNKAYVQPDGRILGNTQTCYVLGIACGLLDAEHEQLAAKYLVEDIASRGGHLSTGFVGTRDLMFALSKAGRHDVAYRLLHNDTFPSWGFTIKNGATSIWERWDGWTPEKGFQDPGMNSFAHYAFGAVYAWMVENIGGIRSDGPAYQNIVIAPRPDSKLMMARTRYRSIRGDIVSEWEREEGAFTLKVTIPANTTAVVRIPAKNADAVRERGKSVRESKDFEVIESVKGEVALKIGSGSYEFKARP